MRGSRNTVQAQRTGTGRSAQVAAPHTELRALLASHGRSPDRCLTEDRRHAGDSA